LDLFVLSGFYLYRDELIAGGFVLLGSFLNIRIVPKTFAADNIT
jgi:hypothetical protein